MSILGGARSRWRSARALPSRRLARLVRPEWFRRTQGAELPVDADVVAEFVRRSRVEVVDPTPLFDGGWYLTRNAPLGGPPPIEHYLTIGAERGLEPGPVFDSSWYEEAAGPVPDRMTPLEHHCSVGWRAAHDPHPLFSTAWYVQQLDEDEDLAGLSPIEHYLDTGWRRGLDPSPVFSTRGYLLRHPDVAAADVNPLVHHLTFRDTETRPASDIVDEDRYRRRHADDPSVDRLGPLAHHLHVVAPAGGVIGDDPLTDRLLAHLVRAHDRARRWLVVGDDRPRIDWTARAAAIEVPASDDPIVSVVIPTLDRSPDVIRCLESIVDAGANVPFEVVLVDDGSTPIHADRFASMRGLRSVRHDATRGFSAACTTGVEASRAPYVVLLNNDTEVLPEWLDELVATAESDPTVGLVGSMLVRSDLRVQEVGCIVLSNGHATQYGCGDVPTRWTYRTQREVDYCSAASLLVRRAVWDAIGGFDRAYDPAYYEDVDLAFAARSMGSKVVVRPQSVVLHREGSTHGLDEDDPTGTKRFLGVNHERFVRKWVAELVLQPTPLAGGRAATASELFRYRDRRRAPHVLVIDHRVPMPDRDAGSQRMLHVVEALVAEGRIVHIAALASAGPSRYSAAFESMGVEVVDAPLESDEFRDLVTGLDDRLEFVFVARPHVVAAVASVLLTHLAGVPIVYDMVDAHGARLALGAAVTGDDRYRQESVRVAAMEGAAARLADVVVTVSEADEVAIEREARVPLRMVRIPTVHVAQDVGGGFEGRSTILFVGGYEHTPNVDAVTWFADEVLPSVRRRLPEVRVVFAGSDPPEAVLRLAGPFVEVPGWVADLGPLHAEARVVIAPVRFGAGVNGKVGDAMARGVPVVTTSLGAAGIGSTDRVDMLLADDPEVFADRVVELATDADLWRSIRTAALATVERSFGRAVSRERVRELLDAVAECDRRRSV